MVMANVNVVWQAVETAPGGLRATKQPCGG
jgi:hypothetical protein